jgi:hypothetical protein
LIRLVAFGITIFLAVLSGLFLSSQESGFPLDSDFTALVDFSASTVPKEQVISDLNGVVDSSGLMLAKVVADPENFLTSQSMYVFGSGVAREPEDITWFRAGMRGELRAASDLGDAALNGTYVFAGSTVAVDELSEWMANSGVQADVQRRTSSSVLSNALFNTGAWLPFLTCIVLLVSLTVSWYVLRARARTLKILNGARSPKILIDDYLSLLRVSCLPVLAGIIVAFAFVGLSGKGAFLFPFGITTLAFLSFALAVMTISAVLISVLTWPTVAGIASRLAPERHFRLVGEVLKAATLVLVALSLPAAGSAIAVATNLSDQGTRWDALSGLVSVRIGTANPTEFDSQMTHMDALVQAADRAGVLTFSYAISGSRDPELEKGGFDGLVMVNREYLEKIAPLMGLTVTPDRPLGDQGRSIPHSELSPGLEESLSNSFELWNRAGRSQDGFEENFATYAYLGPKSFPGLVPSIGEMENFQRPLIAVIESPSSTFDSSFLSSTLSSGNQTFSDSEWLRNYLAQSPFNDYVLSIDRVSDSGLFMSQQENQTASVRILSYSLVMLALLASIAVSAWIYALARSRRLFAQRTSGWRWTRALISRMLWEATLASAVTILVLAGELSSPGPEKWWILAAIPLYLAISAGVHLIAVRKAFELRLARSE